ncbi:MAG: ABC transporter permease [Lacrimispora celerecrescens]|nr:ABC transporter permease [Lacrimispora celerecrescens]
MVKGTLFVKSIRDMRKSLVQFISIFLMSMIAVSIVTGLDSIWKTMEVRSETMYRDTNLSDLWVMVPNPSDRDLWKVKRIKGVEAAERRLVMNCDADLPDTPTLRLYAMESRYDIDQPYKVEGKPLTKRGAVLDRSFAEANGLRVGDKIRIKVNDMWLEYTIEELALNSEHIFSVKDSSSMIPDAKSYGFIMVNMDTVRKAYGGNSVYNQIALRMAGDGEERVIREQLENIFGYRLMGVMNHKDHISVESIQARMVLFKTLSTVFPIMFFLVTALITLSTMVRLVEDQRNQIGILKATGYSKRAIMWHYTSYGIYVGMLGALMGVVAGPNVIGRILIRNIKVLYTLPGYNLELNTINIILSILLIVVSTGGISCYSSLKLLGEAPAELLRTKPPKKGNHILLERFTGIWSSMKFSGRLIARNTSKNKARMLMSILGVMGCSGLIIGALSLKTMIGGISEETFGEIYTYDQRLSLDKSVSHRFVKNLHLDGDYQDMQETSIQITTESEYRSMVKLTLLPEENPLVHLKDEKGNPVFIPNEGMVITRKLADILNVEEGDTLEVKVPDESSRPVKIRAVATMVTGQGIYINNDYWESLGGSYEPTALLVKWNQAPDQAILSSSRVIQVTEKDQQERDLKSNTKIVDIAAIMLIAAGSSLAFVVIYNMSILNFFERVRDLATLKVLGFYEREIRYLVLFENFLSTAAGILLGIPTGKMIVLIFVSGFGDDFDLNGSLNIWNILLSAALTLLFMIGVNLIVSKKMRQIDMLEALKSVE